MGVEHAAQGAEVVPEAEEALEHMGYPAQRPALALEARCLCSSLQDATHLLPLSGADARMPPVCGRRLTGADGVWPAKPVRDLVEQLRSEKLLRSLRAGCFNQRGVVSRSPLAGGRAERAIANRYEADAKAIEARWPRTAAFLRSFAELYAWDAERAGLEAELRHDLDW